jgi:Ca2+-binding RTX toxin-like protein
MADVVWNFKFQSEYVYEAFFEVLGTQDIPVATTTGFLMQSGSLNLIFQGTFTVNGFDLTGGTITGFNLSVSGIPLLSTTGYSIDAKAFENAVVNNGFQALALLVGMPMTMNGSEQSDALTGSLGFGDPALADLLYGNGGDDQLRGGGGDDFMSGGAGDDRIEGGAGSDTGDYSEKADTVVVALTGSTVSVVKVGGIDEDEILEVENIIGGAGNDTITGDGLVNMLVGNDGDDRLAGGDGNDSLLGGMGRDRIDGGKDNDTIDGGDGKDVLVGGKNSDSFVFSTALDPKDNVDKIKDFKPGIDAIILTSTVFTALGFGKLKGKFFEIGEKAKDGNDHVIYDDKSGLLSYDADGLGGMKAVAFAKLKGSPDIGADDFLVL